MGGCAQYYVKHLANGRWQIRKVGEEWYLITPIGWAWYYFSFEHAVKWLDSSMERYRLRVHEKA